MENKYKNYLGSGDAKMIYKIGETSFVSPSYKNRIANLLGIKEQVMLYTPEMLDGLKKEEEYLEVLKMQYDKVKHNPIYISEKLSNEIFKIGNHIDYEIETDNEIIWVELKTTKLSEEYILKTYMPQLQWHAMLLKERTKDKKHKLILVILDILTNKTKEIEIKYEEYYEKTFIKGIEILKEYCKNFKYEEDNNIYIEDVNEKIRELIETYTNINLELNKIKKVLDEIKEEILRFMLENNINKIENDIFILTLVRESKEIRIDTNTLKKDNPELVAKYTKEITKSPYLLLNFKTK